MRRTSSLVVLLLFLTASRIFGAGITLMARCVDVRQALKMLAAQSKVTIETGDEVHGLIDVRLKDVGPVEGAVAIARLRGYKVAYRGGTLYVGTEESFKSFGAREILKVVPVEHRNIEVVKGEAKGRFPKFVLKSDPKLGLIFVLRPDTYSGSVPRWEIPSAKWGDEGGSAARPKPSETKRREPKSIPSTGRRRVGSALTDLVERCKEKLRADPKNGRAYRKLGVAYRRLGRKDLAQKALTRAVKLRPRDPMARSHLCLVLLDQGDRKAAARQFRAVKRLDRSLARKLKRKIDSRR